MSRKRYRYTGKEKDEETGLCYHGARYYMPWLGRWERPDPAGMVDGPNRFAYVRGNPVGASDPTGLGTRLTEQSVQDAWGNEVRQTEGAAGGFPDEEIIADPPPPMWEEAGLVFGESGVLLYSTVKEGATTHKEVFSLLPEDLAFYEARHGAGSREATWERDVAEAYNQDMMQLVIEGGLSVYSAREHLSVLNKEAFLEAGIGAVAAWAEAVSFLTRLSQTVPRWSPRRLGGAEATPAPQHAGKREGYESWTDPSALEAYTGRSTTQGNRALEAIVKEDFAHLRFTYPPRYSPNLGYGVAQYREGTQIGYKALESRHALRDTLVHEELHHRWWSRGRFDLHHNTKELVSPTDKLFYETVHRYMRLRGWMK